MAADDLREALAELAARGTPSLIPGSTARWVNARDIFALLDAHPTPSEPYIDLLFTVPPGPDSEFVETEAPDGRSIKAGEWIPPTTDKFWRLRIRTPSEPEATVVEEDYGDGCDCTELCSMGPTCPGGMLARLPGAGCWRDDAEIAAAVAMIPDPPAPTPRKPKTPLPGAKFLSQTSSAGEGADAGTPSEPEATVVEEWGVRRDGPSTWIHKQGMVYPKATQGAAEDWHRQIDGWTVVRRTRTTYADRVTEWTEADR